MAVYKCHVVGYHDKDEWSEYESDGGAASVAELGAEDADIYREDGKHTLTDEPIVYVDDGETVQKFKVQAWVSYDAMPQDDDQE